MPKPDAVREEMLHHAKRFLARLDAATQHAVLIEETKTALRRQYEPFRSRLELDKATFEQFLAVLLPGRLATTALDGRVRHLALQQALRHLDAAIHQLARAGAQRLAVRDEVHVALHLLELPAQGMRDE